MVFEFSLVIWIELCGDMCVLYFVGGMIVVK